MDSQSPTGGFYTASLDGPGALFVARLPIALPHDRAGIIAERPATAPATDPATALGHRSASVVAAESRLEWFEIQRPELVRVALDMARMAHVESVTICPAGVSPGRTVMAHTVGSILRAQRGAGHSVVMCGKRPAFGQGITAIPHEFTVKSRKTGEEHMRVVWEMITWPRIPEWLGYLALSALAAW
jgi:hypothetical protein